MLYKLDKKGKAGIVLANGSLSASGKSELEFRKNLILNNKVDAIISLPDKLFYTTGIPACL
jgi:type I restriction enzyme M protein